MHISQSYSLSQASFQELFKTQVPEAAFQELKAAATSGNPNAVDALHNLALRHDDLGKKAEKVLFDLFTGTISGKAGIADDIQATCKKLYETLSSNQFENAGSNLRKPGVVLFLAGLDAEAGSQTRNDISQRLMERNNEISQNQYEQVGGADDYWSSSRFVSDAELAWATDKLQQVCRGSLSINRPLALIDPASKENLLADILFEKTNNQGEDFLDKPELFTLNVGDHWILFAAFNQPDGTRASAVFDSHPSSLSPQHRKALEDAAAFIGATKPTFVARDLQTNVPNGCGLFAHRGIQELINNPGTQPEQVWKSFADKFEGLDAEEQKAFNTGARLRLLEGVLL